MKIVVIIEIALYKKIFTFDKQLKEFENCDKSYLKYENMVVSQ
jgi:hypothetical protein